MARPTLITRRTANPHLVAMRTPKNMKSPLDEKKDHVDRRRDLAIREKALPQSLCARALEPHHGQQEHTCRDQIEAGSQAREQVEA